jgi:hypothetical protein
MMSVSAVAKVPKFGMAVLNAPSDVLEERARTTPGERVLVGALRQGLSPDLHVQAHPNFPKSPDYVGVPLLLTGRDRKLATRIQTIKAKHERVDATITALNTLEKRSTLKSLQLLYYCWRGCRLIKKHEAIHAKLLKRATVIR